MMQYGQRRVITVTGKCIEERDDGTSHFIVINRHVTTHQLNFWLIRGQKGHKTTRPYNALANTDYKQGQRGMQDPEPIYNGPAAARGRGPPLKPSFHSKDLSRCYKPPHLPGDQGMIPMAHVPL